MRETKREKHPDRCGKFRNCHSRQIQIPNQVTSPTVEGKLLHVCASQMSFVSGNNKIKLVVFGSFADVQKCNCSDSGWYLRMRVCLVFAWLCMLFLVWGYF